MAQPTTYLAIGKLIFASASTVRRGGRIRIRETPCFKAGDCRSAPDLGQHVHPGGHAQVAGLLPPPGLIGARLGYELPPFVSLQKCIPIYKLHMYNLHKDSLHIFDKKLQSDSLFIFYLLFIKLLSYACECDLGQKPLLCP